MSKVLIIGQRQDRHIQAVTSTLQNLGGDPLIFDHTQIEAISRFTYTFGSEKPKGAVYVNEKWHDLSTIDAVWWRVKPLFQIRVPNDSSYLANDFALREWQSALASLPTFTPHARWVNPWLSDQVARHKPIQLAVAQALGLQIPQTLISNDIDTISASFEQEAEEHIYKVLTWYYEPPDRLVFTSSVDTTSLHKDRQAISVAPGIFQTRIPKKYEVRATVIEDKVFSIQIDSQKRQDTCLDWRRNQYVLPCTVHRLPPEIEKSLVVMNKQLGLVFGAYDLIMTPEGQYVFLEVNPSGQWLWLELITKIPITQALAAYLLKAHRIKS